MTDDEYRKRWRESFKDAAPAAPSVGEPDPEWATINDALCERLHEAVTAFDGTDSGPLSLDLAVLWGGYQNSLAECAALRSSLEEARKDSERLARIDSALASLSRWMPVISEDADRYDRVVMRRYRDGEWLSRVDVLNASRGIP